MMRRSAAMAGRPGGLLFTPGPLCTSEAVKAAMMADYGSRDSAFVQCVRDVRAGLLEVGGVSPDAWTAIPLQGSGTMGLEASIATTAPPGAAHVLVLCNGSYGSRLAAISRHLRHRVDTFEAEEGAAVDLAAFAARVRALAPTLTNVLLVHCETSTGMFNPVPEMSRIVREAAPQATVLVDGMSSFGAVPLDVDASCDVLVSSANKCIQGVPGFSVVLARRALLERSRGWSPSFTLDLVTQADGLDRSGQFNQTPPVHAIVAFRQALREHRAEGGVAGRAARYQALCGRILEGMKALGFRPFLPEGAPGFGYIITSYHAHDHPAWDFERFYGLLQRRGVVIYPGKVTRADTFRIGSIGDLAVGDAEVLLAAARGALEEMGVL